MSSDATIPNFNPVVGFPFAANSGLCVGSGLVRMFHPLFRLTEKGFLILAIRVYTKVLTGN
jgi:hypothetical protein